MADPFDPRLNALSSWLDDLSLDNADIRPASSDASFRRYFRVRTAQQSFIVMDAPPAKEDVRPFIKIAELFRRSGVQTPEVFAQDESQGFLLLSDFGDLNYLHRLDEASADDLYRDAIASLVRMQKGVDIDSCDLPPYNEKLLRDEMNLFKDWFLEKLLAIALTKTEQTLLEKVWNHLTESALQQPKVCVHRDYHSRNLMITESQNPGVLDFQDAVIGPITYDLVSLLKDCYIAWPQEKIEAWVDYYCRQSEIQSDSFMRWFDWMGMQRHLKAIGIFSRLNLRDQKPGYLNDIPRTLNYVIQTAEFYPELTDFKHFLEQSVLDKMKEALK